MTAPLQGDRPPDRVHHSWRCTRRSPLTEGTRIAPDGREITVSVCTGCGSDDLAHRLLGGTP
jgi:hypothetical protein